MNTFCSGGPETALVNECVIDFSCLPQTYAKSKLTVQELTKYATDAAADYTGSAKAAAEEVRTHVPPTLCFRFYPCTPIQNPSTMTVFRDDPRI